MSKAVARTEAPQLSQDELIARLDPERDYGDRTYEQVVEEVRAGALILHEGFNVPRIVDAQTGVHVKGTGRPPGVDGAGPQQLALAEFRARAMDDLPKAYAWLIKGMKPKVDSEGNEIPGDPRYFKIYFENLIGPVKQSVGGDEMGKAFQMLLERLDNQPVTRTVVVDG